MGIESDQLVFDYLSRVGDTAQQQQLSSGARMRLVATLREEIDRQRGKQAADSPAAVRRIIGRLGDPDELVAAAASSADGSVRLPERTEPAATQRRGVPRPRRTGLRKELRKESSRKGASEDAAQVPTEVHREADGPRGEAVADVPRPPAAGGPSAPHRAGSHELGPSGGEPEWWRVESGPFGGGVGVPGFSGGVEIPAMLRPPAPEPAGTEAEGARAEAGGPDAAEAAGAAGGGARRRWRLRRRRAVEIADGAGTGRGLGFSHPLLLLAAALLVAGAFLGSWLALGGGWLLAYSSRKLSRAEAKWAAMGLPGVVVAGAFGWLWGRMDGRWGEPIPKDGMAEALSGVWPVVVRVAAVASALFLVWRARRRG